MLVYEPGRLLKNNVREIREDSRCFPGQTHTRLLFYLNSLRNPNLYISGPGAWLQVAALVSRGARLHSW